MARDTDPIEAELSAIDQEGKGLLPKKVMRYLPVGIAVIVVAAFGGIVWYAYNSGIKEGSEFAAPVLKPEGPSKIAPDAPGGEEIPHKDKKVYSLVDNSEVSNRVERLLPPPENPLPNPVNNPPALSKKLEVPATPPTAEAPPPPIPSITAPRPKPEPQTAVPDPKPASKPELPAVPKPAAPKAVAAAPKAVTEAPATTKEAPPPPKPVEKAADKPAEKMAEKTAEKPAEMKDSAPAVPPPTPQQTASAAPDVKAPAPKSGYRIQLASMRSEESAKAAWDKSVKQHGKVLSALDLIITPVEISGRGTFYRVQAGYLQNKATAQRICEELKSKKTGCLVINP